MFAVQDTEANQVLSILDEWSEQSLVNPNFETDRSVPKLKLDYTMTLEPVYTLF